MESCIFIAKAHTIDLALNIISESKHKNFILFSDSISVLLSWRNKKNWKIPLSLNSWVD